MEFGSSDPPHGPLFCVILSNAISMLPSVNARFDTGGGGDPCNFGARANVLAVHDHLAILLVEGRGQAHIALHAVSQRRQLRLHPEQDTHELGSAGGHGV